jgi:hypothetical protein
LLSRSWRRLNVEDHGGCAVVLIRTISNALLIDNHVVLERADVVPPTRWGEFMDFVAAIGATRSRDYRKGFADGRAYQREHPDEDN